MKSLWGSLLFIILFSSNAYSTEIKDIDMFGYVRAGVGTNTYGGAQECFFNSGTSGNQSRLGNECSNYLEIGTRFNHIKGDTKKAFTQFRISNSSLGQETYESSEPDISFVEVFAEMQGMNDLPWSFWVGKKFYRDRDVYMNDDYYYGNMSGNGGGIGNVDLFGGKFSFAYLRKINTGPLTIKGDVISTNATNSTISNVKIKNFSTETNIGLQGITVYDARLKDIRLTYNLKENFWVAFGHAPESTNSTSGVKYLKTNGYILGTLFDLDLNGKGFNHFAIMFGQGLMNSFNLYGNSTITSGSQQSNTKRLRLINHTTYDVNEKWAFHVSLSHERLMVSSDTTEQWLGAGIRPIYRVTQNFHLVTEAGTSLVQNGGAHKLTRLTFAPQLSINESIWGRPVLRAFYTHSFWNDKNKANIAQNAPTYSDKTDGGSFGLQMESFF